MAGIIIGLIIAVYAAFVIRKKVNDFKAGKTCGSCGSCPSQSKCSDFVKS